MKKVISILQDVNFRPKRSLKIKFPFLALPWSEGVLNEKNMNYRFARIMKTSHLCLNTERRT